MPIYLAEVPLSESFAFLNRSSLDKFSLATHRFNKIISFRFKNAPLRVFENVVIHCEKYHNNLDVNGIVAFYRRIFPKFRKIVRSGSTEENELDFLCNIVWDNRSVTTSFNKVWKMITKEHTYARKLTLIMPVRRNGRRSLSYDHCLMVTNFWCYIGNLLHYKLCIGALSISALNFTHYQSNNPELLSSHLRLLQNCSRITSEDHFPHLVDLCNFIVDSNRKCRFVISWIFHSNQFGRLGSNYMLFFSALEQRFRCAKSMAPFKFTVQFHGCLEENIVDHYSSIVNFEAAKVLNIKAVAESPSQIIVSVKEI